MSSGEAKLGCATTGELLDEIRARLAVVDALDYRTVDRVNRPKGDVGLEPKPLEETSRVIIERAEAKTPEPTVSECAETISKAIQGVVTHMDSNNPYDSRFIRELGEVLALEEMSDLLNNPALAQPRDKLHQTINLLAYLCHDLHYDLAIHQPFPALRWIVEAKDGDETIIMRSDDSLLTTIKFVYGWLVTDCKNSPAVEKTKTPAQVMADLEANALDVIAEVKNVKKKKEVDELIERATKKIVDAIEAVGRKIRTY